MTNQVDLRDRYKDIYKIEILIECSQKMILLLTFLHFIGQKKMLFKKCVNSIVLIFKNESLSFRDTQFYG